MTEEIAPQPLRPYDSSVSEEVELSDRTVVVGPTTTPRRRPASHARPESPTDLTDLRWLIGAWVIVLVFAAITAVWSEHVGIPLRDPQGKMFRGRLTSAAVLFGLFAVADAGVRSLRTTRSLRGTLGVLRARWPGRRLLIAANGLLVYHLVYVCYRNLKSWDALNQPRDRDLLSVEKWLFLGHSPAQLLHDLLGTGTAAYVLESVYTSFAHLVPLAVVGALVFVDRIRDGYVLLVSAMWVWVLGVASYYLIPTLGPFASAPGDFARLPDTSITSTQAEYLAARAHLLAHPAAGDAFASISAFASLHVGFTFMVVLMLRYYGLTRLSHVATAYLVAVMLATVYFGWHFALDVVAGLALAAVAVLLGRLVVYPRGRP